MNEAKKKESTEDVNGKALRGYFPPKIFIVRLPIASLLKPCIKASQLRRSPLGGLIRVGLSRDTDVGDKDTRNLGTGRPNAQICPLDITT